jgi:hypothetical protein
MALINPEDVARLEAYRERLFAAIKRAVDESGHCKSYEGRLDVCLPHYFHGPGDGWRLRLRCYVLGPSRQYEWDGPSLAECIGQAERALAAPKWEGEDEDPDCPPDPFGAGAV